MDDLIVIILTLIIVVVGAIGQIKKKRPELLQEPGKDNNNNEAGNTGGFWDFLEGEQQFVTQQTDVYPEEEPKIEPIQPKKEEYKFVPSNEGKTDSAKPFFNFEEEDEKKKKPREKFSLRKAIIYSEIINRKYN